MSRASWRRTWQNLKKRNQEKPRLSCKRVSRSKTPKYYLCALSKKKMVRGTTSRMIFVDSTVNTHHDRTRISLPPHPFSVVGNERAAFSLQQFSIRRNWYNINPTNNTGYVYITVPIMNSKLSLVYIPRSKACHWPFRPR